MPYSTSCTSDGHPQYWRSFSRSLINWKSKKEKKYWALKKQIYSVVGGKIELILAKLFHFSFLVFVVFGIFINFPYTSYFWVISFCYKTKALFDINYNKQKNGSMNFHKCNDHKRLCNDHLFLSASNRCLLMDSLQYLTINSSRVFTGCFNEKLSVGFTVQLAEHCTSTHAF